MHARQNRINLILNLNSIKKLSFLRRQESRIIKMRFYLKNADSMDSYYAGMKTLFKLILSGNKFNT